MKLSVERYLVCLLLFLLFIGPWTVTWARLLGFGEYERTSIIDMTLYLARKIPETFLTGGALYLGVPVFFLLLRRFLPHLAAFVYCALVNIGLLVSICLCAVVFVPNRHRRPLNPVGDVLVVDAGFMFLWQSGLILVGDLPPFTLLCGPLYGLCHHIRQPTPRRTSLLIATLLLYAVIGSLYRAYHELPDHKSVFTNTVAFSEWYSYEWYAGITVLYAFVVLSASIPYPYGFLESLEVIAYVFLFNGSIAAGWAALKGHWRLEAPTPSSQRHCLRCL